MEIIPTIITVLEIAAVLTVVALVISYISLKFRQKSEAEKAANVAGRSGNSPSHHTPKPKSDPYTADKAGSSQQNKAKKHSADPVLKPNPSNDRKQTEKSVQPFRNKRIEVIDNLHHSDRRKNASKGNEKPAKKSTDFGTLGNDILGKYENEKTDQMFSLKAGDGKKTKD